MLLVAASAWSLPFEPTTDPYATTTKWYQIQSDGTYLYSMYRNFLQGSTTPATDDKFLWCFVGTESTGYKIFHRDSQSYLWNGTYLNGTGDEAAINYVGVESENSFHIYFTDQYYHNVYLAIDQGNVVKVYANPNSFTAVEVTVEPQTPPITIPYESLTALDYHVPHNSLGNIEAQNYTKLIDKNKNTQWCVDNRSGAWETIWLDFESDVWFIPDGYILTTGIDIAMNPNRNPKEWVLYGKEFITDEWTELAHVTDGSQAGLGTQNTTDYTFDITGATKGYRYFRFEVRQINGADANGNYYFELAELQLFGTKVEDPDLPQLPFEPTTDPSLSTTKWYQITLDGQYLFSDSNSIYVKTSSVPSAEDNYLWCFVVNVPTGYNIYNRGRQAYMRYCAKVNGTGDEADLNYVELNGEDNFYIYYNFEETQKLYLAYNSTNGVFGSNNQRANCKAVPHNDTPPPTVPGDLNGDGQVDISDVNAVINMMLGKVSPTAAGDVTGDGNVDISDVNAVINLMLGKTTPVTPPEADPTPQTLTATGYNIPHNGLDNNGDEGYAKLVDGDKYTKWCVENRSGSWETIWIDLKSNVAFKPTNYILTTGGDTNYYYTRNPKNWKIYGRNSESESWTELVHVTDGSGLGTANTTDYTFEFNGITQAYKYYRFEVIEIEGKDKWNTNYYTFQLGELTLVGVPQ